MLRKRPSGYTSQIGGPCQPATASLIENDRERYRTILHSFGSLRNRHKTQTGPNAVVYADQKGKNVGVVSQREALLAGGAQNEGDLNLQPPVQVVELAEQPSLGSIRRRIVRKASTLNLHRYLPQALSSNNSPATTLLAGSRCDINHRQQQLFPQIHQQPYIQEHNTKHCKGSQRREHLFPDVHDELSERSTLLAPPSSQIFSTLTNSATEIDSRHISYSPPSSAGYSEAADSLKAATSVLANPTRERSCHSADSQVIAIVGGPLPCPLPDYKESSAESDPTHIIYVGKSLQVQRSIYEAQQEAARSYINYITTHHDSKGVETKMAAPTAAPPLPYEKLKQITVDACDNTLGTTKAYDHSKTELWNTTIINTILAELVGETSNAANGASVSASQSKYKFVVNSTIVQHRSSTVDESGKGQGRRGMHSAAGAYWNNDKDGMWSFKYEAAEKMGLDAVIGIVWIWVG